MNGSFKHIIGTTMVCISPLNASAQATEPNVLIIYCDQLSAWTLGAYGGTEVLTPNIDRLAHKGALVTNFYVSTPVSTPSRGSFMSGLYPQQHGAYKNDMQMNQHINTFAIQLRKNGYITGYAGKYHLDGNPKRPGWDIRGNDMGWSDRTNMYSFGHYKSITSGGTGEYRVMTNKIATDPNEYPTDWFTNAALNFIEKHKEEKFCYMLSIPDPHGPYSVRAPYDSLYPLSNIELPQTLIDPPRSDHFFYNESRTSVDDNGNSISEITNQLPLSKSQYFGMIKCIDDNVGRILAYLDANNLTEKTIIIFTADHGDMMGEHARMAKAVPFDAAARVPFIVHYPPLIPAGKVVNEMMSCIDFFPTLTSWLKIDCPSNLHGRDASALFYSSKSGEWDNTVFYRTDSGSYTWLGVATNRYKLIYGKNDLRGKALLLDREADPTEAYNFFDDIKYTEVIRTLNSRLNEYCTTYNDPFYAWLSSRITENQAEQRIIYVSADATEATSGNSWTSATTLEDAVQKAKTLGYFNHQIWVKSGKYNCINLNIEGCKLYGGFSGNETSLDQRNWNLYPTILDANKQHRVLKCDNPSKSSKLLNGFIIQNGSVGVNLQGGGVQVQGDDTEGYYFSIQNCIFRGNSATSVRGGAINIASGSQHVISNTLLCNNTANLIGGAISVVDGAGITIINSTIANNTTISGNAGDDSGAGVALMGETSQITLFNSLLYNNTAGENSIRESISLFGGKVMSTYSAIETTRSFEKEDDHFLKGIRLSLVNSPEFASVDPEKKGASVHLDQIENMNFSLSSNSVAINAGNNIYINTATKDLAGNSRLFDGVVDLGAYEFSNNSSGTVTQDKSPSSFFVSNGYLYADGVDNGELIAVYSPLGILIKHIRYYQQPVYLGTVQKGVCIITCKGLIQKIIQ